MGNGDRWLISLRRPIDAGFAVAQQLRGLAAGWHWSAQVTAVWALGRVFTLAMVQLVARQQGPNPWSPAGPDYLAYINGWDAGYYEQIHDAGYPRELPRDADGAVTNNPWAFLPLFPLLVRGVTLLTGLTWLTAAPLVSMLACLSFLLVAYRLFLKVARPATSLFAVTLISFGTAAPVLQFPYAEALGLLLVAAALLQLIEQRFLWAAPLVAASAFARPLAAPMALTCLIAVGAAWWERRRTGARASRRLAVSSGVLIVVAGAAVVAWPALTGILTGEPSAYFLTEASWHAGRHMVPGMLFLQSAAGFFGVGWGTTVAAVALLLVVAMMFSASVLRLGAVLWAWTGSVIGYLVAVAPVNASLIRLLLPAFPLAVVLARQARARSHRVLLLIALGISQIVWLGVFWHWTGTAPDPAP